MGLTDENRKDIVAYRIERAFVALEQAKGNLEMGYLEITANRLYYAAYYAASALLIAHEIRVRSHEGCIGQFNLHLNFLNLESLNLEFLIHNQLTQLLTKFKSLCVKNHY